MAPVNRKGVSSPGPDKTPASPTSSKTRSPKSSSNGSLGAGLAVAGLAVCIAAVLLAKLDVLSALWGPPDLRPLAAKRMTDLSQFTKAYKESMLWGSYRSGLYFGMRTRSPKALMTGMMWFDPDDYNSLMQERVRHEARQEDGLQGYGWIRHDGRTWGQQVIVDGSYNITLTMVKQSSEGSGHGGDWVVRMNVSRAVNSTAPPAKRISLVMYITDQDTPQSTWSVLPFGEPDNLQQGVKLVSGGNKVVGPWSLYVQEVGVSPSGKRKARSRLNYFAMPAVEGEHDYRLHLKNLMLGIMYEHMQKNPMSDRFQMYLPNGAVTYSDLAIFQVTVPVGGCVDWVFLAEGHQGSAGASEERLELLTGDHLSRIIDTKQEQFEARFHKTFLSPAGSVPEPEAEVVAKAALSNLLGSMGYFYGRSKVRIQGEARDYWAAPLYSAVPSRSFFPRGFLWDEGFHQLLVARWDPELSRDAIAHWLDLMNCRGWIPREQILGAEAEARVPAEFVVQDPAHANPPSLFLPISLMANQLRDGQSDDQQVLRSFLEAAWPRLQAWYNWFNTTQIGTAPTSYRWRGRNRTTQLELNPKTLTSGLDDFPRASHPSADERHLDLRCWMALASEAMATISTALGLPESVSAPYKQTHAALSDLPLLDQLHWDAAAGQYLDWGLHTERVKLVRQGGEGGGLVRVVKEAPRLQFVPHFGYVSLFPLLMKLLPADSPRLGDMLASLRDTDLLWSPYGLRSLGTVSSLYRQYNTEHDKPYWRGQVWININYMTLSALRHYASLPGPHQQTAAEMQVELKEALTQTLVSQYHQRGYLYEQYDDNNGNGSSSHPFTGWTALIALIATGAY